MRDAQILAEMLSDSIRVGLESEYDKWLVRLQEPQSPESIVIIRGIPEDALVIKADEFKSPDMVFKGGRGECKRADYIIISTALVQYNAIPCQLARI